MGFLDELKKMTRPYDDDDEFFDDEDEAIPVAEEPAPARPAQARPAQARPAAGPGPGRCGQSHRKSLNFTGILQHRAFEFHLPLSI